MLSPTDFLMSLPVALVTLVVLPLHVSRKPKNDNDGKCELIGTFSLITQALLGLLCLSSLIIKRYYEHPLRRTWPVWLFDVSKQLIGALGVHIFNVILSILKTSPADILQDDPPASDDPCDWYFLNIVFDCTIGVYILYLVFNGLTKVCKQYLGITQIDSGRYGADPNKPSKLAFIKQLSIYFTALMITKVLLYGVVECFETELLWLTSHVLLLWLDMYPEELEIFIVMFVVPIFMNCLQLILIDNFIQNQAWVNVNKRINHEHHDGETESILRGEINTLLEEEGDKDMPTYGSF